LKQNYLRRKNRDVDITRVKEQELQGYNYAQSHSQVVQASEGFRPEATVKDLSRVNWDQYLHYLYEDLEAGASFPGVNAADKNKVAPAGGATQDEHPASIGQEFSVR
jgi:hypothetical protein